MSAASETIPRAGRVATAGEHRFRPAAVLMNLWVYPLLVLWTASGTLLLLPALWVIGRLFLRWDAARVIRLLVWVYGRGWLLIISPFVSFRREGFAENPPPQPGIVVVNHRSFFDTYFMGGLPFSNCVFAVRSWPFRTLFWYTAIMRLARYLDVESLGWEGTVAACRREMAGGAVMVFFPEGHRSRTGELQRFYTGAFLAACATGAPVVPLCITGTETLLPPGRLWLQPARVRLRALPALDPAGFPGELGHVALRKRVKALMAAALREMREEAA